MQINEFLQRYRRMRFGMNVTRPRVMCADGYSVSVQAGRGIYSAPLDTVYAYVPVRIVDAVLEKHGGIAGADFSNGTAVEWSAIDDAGGGDAGWRLR